jgi:RNA polymerase sigma-70 factor (ECF subfamily)
MQEFHSVECTRPAGETETQVSLLERIRISPDDPELWTEFVSLYGGTILRWCRNWGLQQADAEDVTQEVFLRLTVRLRSFHHDPNRNFRAWLKTVAHRERQHYVTKHRKAGQASGGDSDCNRLSEIEARQDSGQRLEELFDYELLFQAAERVRHRVDPKAWEAFQLLALEQFRGAEVAGRLGMKVGSVFVARSRVQRKLREELAGMGAQAAGQ